MFSEFELAIHEAVERGEALTGSSMTQIYGEILKRYHGYDVCVMEITDREMIEWAYIPHFYYNFYVYQYATSIMGVRLPGTPELWQHAKRETYIKFLEAGVALTIRSRSRAAGLDMTSRAPYDAVIDRMDAVMDQIEMILENREG